MEQCLLGTGTVVEYVYVYPLTCWKGTCIENTSSNDETQHINMKPRDVDQVVLLCRNAVREEIMGASSKLAPIHCKVCE